MAGRFLSHARPAGQKLKSGWQRDSPGELAANTSLARPASVTTKELAMQTNRIAPQTIRPQLSPSEDPGALTQQDIDELTALVQPELERAGTWRGWLCCCLRCLFPCICCVEACHSYRVSKRVMERMEARAAAQAPARLAP
jgi:hypothetical protein